MNESRLPLLMDNCAILSTSSMETREVPRRHRILFNYICRHDSCTHSCSISTCLRLITQEPFFWHSPSAVLQRNEYYYHNPIWIEGSAASGTRWKLTQRHCDVFAWEGGREKGGFHWFDSAAEHRRSKYIQSFHARSANSLRCELFSLPPRVVHTRETSDGGEERGARQVTKIMMNKFEWTCSGIGCYT